MKIRDMDMDDPAPDPASNRTSRPGSRPPDIIPMYYYPDGISQVAPCSTAQGGHAFRDPNASPTPEGGAQLPSSTGPADASSSSSGPGKHGPPLRRILTALKDVGDLEREMETRLAGLKTELDLASYKLLMHDPTDPVAVLANLGGDERFCPGRDCDFLEEEKARIDSESRWGSTETAGEVG